MRRDSRVIINLIDQLLLNTVCIFVSDLASSSGLVSAAVVPQAQLTDIRGARTVKDRLADREDRILLFAPPQTVHRDLHSRYSRRMR